MQGGGGEFTYNKKENTFKKTNDKVEIEGLER